MRNNFHPATRRHLLQTTAVTATGMLIARFAPAADSPANSSAHQQTESQKEPDVPPTEDLMREHGVLKRIMLIYDEYRRRIDALQELPPQPLADAAAMIRSFVEDYHEKNEENYLFPRFEQSHKLVDLVTVL